MQYLELVNEVANKTNLPPQTIRLVLDTLKSIILEQLCKRESVILRDFGTFHVGKGHNPSTNKSVPTARFRAAKAIKNLLKKGTTMEKYGVDTNEEKTKTATEGQKCPECGATLKTGTNVPVCPNCGTKPFEEKK